MKSQSFLCGLFVLIVCSFFACNPNTYQDHNNQSLDTVQMTTEPAPQSNNFFSEEEQAILGQYFKTGWIDSLSDNMFAFREAKTDAELELAFVTGQSLQVKLENRLGEDVDVLTIREVLSTLDSVMKPYVASCVAECTRFAFSFSITELREFSKKTTGKSDNSFCDLMEIACGEYGGRTGDWYNFFERSWDLGGGSVLGNQICLNFLEKSWKHSQTTPLFRSHIMSVRKACIRDMKHPVYMQKKELVLDELYKILSAKILNSEEMEEVEALKTKLDTIKEGVQYDCADFDCDFGG